MLFVSYSRMTGMKSTLPATKSRAQKWKKSVLEIPGSYGPREKTNGQPTAKPRVAGTCW